MDQAQFVRLARAIDAGRPIGMPRIGVRLDPDYLRHLRDQQAAMAARQPLTPDQRRLLDQVLPIDPDRNEVSACRLILGWRLDRAALEDAVRRFAPTVPVIDGGRQDAPEPSLREVFRLLRTLRSSGGNHPPAGAAG
jgi:hypothetical protein